MMRLGKSAIANKGVIAHRFIKKGSLILIMRGTIIKKRDRPYGPSRIEDNWVSIGRDLWLDPKYPIKYTNHSCKPNAGFKTERKLYAICDIAIGEEITIDYSTVEAVSYWTMNCNCGASNCRGIIRSIQSLADEKYLSYLPYIAPYIRSLRRKGISH